MIKAATSSDYATLLKVWELSVRATHYFLSEDYLQEIKDMLPAIFPQVPHLYLSLSDTGEITGFVGVVEDKIEMLFIHPDHRGRGIGSQLLHFSIQELKAEKVDVNEQNVQALGFYKRSGFIQTGYQPRDGLGRDHPIILMQLSASFR